MRKTILVLGVFCILFLSGQTSFAQITIAGEGGYLTTEHGNGSKKDVPIFGAALSGIIFGDTKKNSGFALQLTAEGKSDSKFENVDLFAAGDLAIRVKNVSFGPGVNYGYVGRSFVDDPTCRNVPIPEPGDAFSSCDYEVVNNQYRRTGKRDTGVVNLVGVGGFVKYNFGPQGRAFVQGRYAHYSKDFGGYLLNNNDLDAVLGTVGGGVVTSSGQIDDYTDYPEFDGGRDIRITAGYVFKGNIFVRGQYTDREIKFTREAGNITGVFDQRNKIFTAGVGISFNLF